MTDATTAIDDTDPAGSGFTDHVLQRAVVIDDARLVYVPMPKAACTSILRGLAELAGLRLTRFDSSLSNEPTSALAIHDMSIWGPSHRLVGRGDDELAEMAGSPDWFWFTMVREPGSRLWSAWQSKVLTREPQMEKRFSGRAWYPADLADAGDLLKHYRAFIDALEVGLLEGDLPSLDDSIFNTHWAPQTALLGSEGLSTVRRASVSQMGELMSDLAEHLIDRGLPPLRVGRSNRSLIPYDERVHGDSGLAVIRRLYRADYTHLGFEEPADTEGSDPSDDWMEIAGSVIPFIGPIADRNLRVKTLHELAQVTARKAARADKAREMTETARANARTARTSLAQTREALGDARANLKHAQAQNAKLREKVAQKEREAAVSNLRATTALNRAAATRSALNRAEKRLSRIESSLPYRLARPFLTISRRLKDFVSRLPGVPARKGDGHQNDD